MTVDNWLSLGAMVVSVIISLANMRMASQMETMKLEIEKLRVYVLENFERKD